MLAGRLFRPYGMVIFKWLLPETRRRWDTDQLRVAIVNISSPMNALLSKPVFYQLFRNLKNKSTVNRSKERLAAFAWAVGSIIFVAGPVVLSSFLAFLIQTVPGTPGSTEICAAYLLQTSYNKSGSETDILAAERKASNAEYSHDRKLADDIWRTVDNTGYNYSALDARTAGMPNYKDKVFVSSECPPWTTVCDPKNTLYMGVEYWVQPSDLGIAITRDEDNVQFGVSTTCYKVLTHARLLNATNTTVPQQQYGLLYGISRPPEYPDNEDVTEIFTFAEAYGKGYFLTGPYFNTNRTHFTAGWTPNDTMSHDGDLVLNIYHVAGVYNPSVDSSNDSIFATPGPAGFGTPLRFTIPILCNTTYSVCDMNENCTTLNGTSALNDYSVKASSGSSMVRGFLQLMGVETYFPLISTLSVSADAIFASKTVFRGNIQSSPNISGHSEILRLILAGRTKLVTAAVRAAATWQSYLVSTDDVFTIQNDDLDSMCAATFIGNNTNLTVSGYNLIVLPIAIVVLILFTYTEGLWRKVLWKHLYKFTIRWNLRTVGQLHRIAVEKEGRTWTVKTVEEWPEGEGEVDPVGLVGNFTGSYHATYDKNAVMVYETEKGIE